MDYLCVQPNTLPYGAKFLRGEILTNGHVENFDEFHNASAHIY